MLKLDVTADVAKATEYLSDVAAKRIPDAAAKALIGWPSPEPLASRVFAGEPTPVRG